MTPNAKRSPRALLSHHPLHVAARMTLRAAWLLPFAALTLAMGMAIYHGVEGLAWPDAFVNAAMLLGGMGPVNQLTTTAGKWLAGAYALFAGLFFIVFAGVVLGPAIHSVLYRFHLETTQRSDAD